MSNLRLCMCQEVTIVFNIPKPKMKENVAEMKKAPIASEKQQQHKWIK